MSDDSTHNIGGSTVVIDQKRMNRGLMTNSLQALTGQAAGLNVQTSGANRMAMLNSVRLRGTTSLTGGNEPLVIIDGVYSNLSALS
ncbi:MAG: TonB-dependent receptor plug domain-containing protein, partial [Bacteroidales bacterium]|nr:TonB-dependent receptor plug domain-containing protein [Bacteroidales bacterium]